ncbi:MAG: pseudouridine synthase [Verrucomicrobiota bacterium]
MLIAFYKPYGVLSQFTAESGKRTLKEFGFPKNVYSLGRLDMDSEGLLLLSDEPELNTRLLSPKNRHARTYWAQVERVPAKEALQKLERGVFLGDYRTLPCRVCLLDPQPEISPRVPPIRFRKTVSTAWMELELMEGKNRQVRKMTAAVGHPALRLLRVKIGKYEVWNLKEGEWKVLKEKERKQVFQNCI